MVALLLHITFKTVTNHKKAGYNNCQKCCKNVILPLFVALHDINGSGFGRGLGFEGRERELLQISASTLVIHFFEINVGYIGCSSFEIPRWSNFIGTIARNQRSTAPISPRVLKCVYEFVCVQNYDLKLQFFDQIDRLFFACKVALAQKVSCQLSVKCAEK